MSRGTASESLSDKANLADGTKEPMIQTSHGAQSPLFPMTLVLVRSPRMALVETKTSLNVKWNLLKKLKR